MLAGLDNDDDDGDFASVVVSSDIGAESGQSLVEFRTAQSRERPVISGVSNLRSDVVSVLLFLVFSFVLFSIFVLFIFVLFM